jgi:hypothetical protein
VTVFLADISSYEDGLDLTTVKDCVGVLAKCTESTDYVDKNYDGWRRQAASLGMLFVAYHFMRTDQSADAQAAHLAAHIGDPSLPVMIDVETEGSSKPNFTQVLALLKACIAHGLRPRLAYIPRWYWERIGSPDMRALIALGVGLISSSYPGGRGTAAQLYPGDSSAGWASYGGVAPLLYQFTNQATEAGHLVDMNAFRGPRSALAAALQEGTPMAPIPPSIGQKWPEIAADFPADGQFDNDTALIYADAGARAAALYAKQARDAVAALAAQVAKAQQAPVIDVKALATALAPLLPQGTNADQIATAVVSHLATTLAKG